MTASPHARLRPLDLGAVALDGGLWADRRRLNRERLIPDGAQRLEEAGSFANLRRAAGLEDGGFQGMRFSDSDVYKWLEAVGWEGSAAGDEAIGAIEAAQREDGYLNSYYMLVQPGPPWSNIASDHEMYCAGHLIEAALAHARVRGDERLLRVARRFADLLVRRFGADGEATS